jgi:hypothetical protein
MCVNTRKQKITLSTLILLNTVNVLAGSAFRYYLLLSSTAWALLAV